MKQSTTQADSNQQYDPQQKIFHRMLEIYYNSNINIHASTLKKCIPDLDTNYENRIIRKNDKIWLEANLCKIFDKGSYKLEKILLTKNQSIKNSLNKYNAQFQRLSISKITQIRMGFDLQRRNYQKQLKKNQKAQTLPFRNKSFSIVNVNSEPSCSQNNPRKTYSSKRVFRVRQFKNNLHQTLNNNRYIEKLQKVKLQSNFAQFFFKKQINPQQPKPVQIQKLYLDKIKAMTNIRWNFNPTEHSHSLVKPSISRQSSKLNNSNQLGFQLRRQSFYKPKSKCHSRNNKLFLNF